MTGRLARRRLRRGAAGVVCNSEGGNRAHPVGNSSPPSNVPISNSENDLLEPSPKLVPRWTQVTRKLDARLRGGGWFRNGRQKNV